MQGANGLRRRADDAEMRELASCLLECVGLLRQQRRVFVSYRRVESRSAAIQLHDLLGSRGFDVFLDTHDIRPGEPFQRSEEHTSELQSLMRISYAVFCLKKKKK